MRVIDPRAAAIEISTRRRFRLPLLLNVAFPFITPCSDLIPRPH